MTFPLGERSMKNKKGTSETTTVQVIRTLLNEAVEKYNKREMIKPYMRPFSQRDIVHISLARLIEELDKNPSG